jgi:hypothetical protein
MSSLGAALACDVDPGFRAALHNFLLASGYARVEVVGTLGCALARLRQQRVDAFLVGCVPRAASIARLERLVRRRQVDAKLLLLLPATYAHVLPVTSSLCVLKVRAFAGLPDALASEADSGAGQQHPGS